jgi:hypothetical protein
LSASKFSTTKEKTVAKHSVDTRNVPSLNQNATPASEADHLKKMPVAPGSVIPPATDNTRVASSVTVKGAPSDGRHSSADARRERLAVPPAKVVGSGNPLE